MDTVTDSKKRLNDCLASGEKKKRLGRAKRSRIRSRPLEPPGSIEQYRRRSTLLSMEDVVKIAQQLEFAPTNIIEVCARHPSGEPLAALLYCLNENELGGRYDELKPFPTIIWLTCPVVKGDISRLEDAGWGTWMQQEVKDGPRAKTLQRIMKEAHDKYARERWGLLTESDREVVVSRKWTSALRDVGIAGIRDPRKVKCLHCHFAHHAARPTHGNIIGEIVELLLEKMQSSGGKAPSLAHDAADLIEYLNNRVEKLDDVESMEKEKG